MNVLPRDQQIQIIACLTEGQSIRATEPNRPVRTVRKFTVIDGGKP